MELLSENLLVIRLLHILTAAVSITLFSLRFYLLIKHPARLSRPWIKTVPHLNDSALLLFAVLLCLVTGQAPGTTPWLSEKVLAIIFYILAGMSALKWAKRRPTRIFWFIIAVSMFIYTANIAVKKTPLIL